MSISGELICSGGVLAAEFRGDADDAIGLV
jgi:hypothetical protein